MIAKFHAHCAAVLSDTGPVTPEEYVEEAGARMRADGSKVSEVSLGDMCAVVGYQSKFRLSWMATKLHLFTVVVPVPVATIDVLSNLTTQAVDYAKRTKGKLRGFQSGVAVIPVVVATEVPANIRFAAESRPAKAFAAFTLPAIVDITGGRTYSYTGRVVWGGIYATWLRERIRMTIPSPSEHTAP